MSEIPLSPQELLRLARLVERYDLTELRYEDEVVRVTLRTGHTVAPAAASPAVAAPSVRTATPTTAAPSAPSADTRSVVAPIMGVFYRSPAPGEPPFVEIGDTVEVGQPVGTIEAMKVFSEVLAEVGGRVKAIPATNGALVQPGETLLALEAV